MATQLEGNPEVGYTISLFVSRKQDAHTVKDGSYDTRSFPAETKELARIELRGADLEALLSDAKEHVDLIRVP
ncbi:hypothetical protein SEA_SKYLORD_63 [Microbacterium phage Skylord]|nr:hypothetical protein SEA_SKYLORD_63 [Microbacterium phage Skylord]